MSINLSTIQQQCLNKLHKDDYKSFDLYDALTNPFLNRISKNKDLLRRIFIQINAKSPVNLHWLGMKKMVHTKTISDLLWYHSVKSGAASDTKEINHYFTWLLSLKNKKGFGWGLNFPYTSRFINADAEMPNLYNTINSGIAICYSLEFLDEKNKPLAIEVINGILHFLEHELGFVDEGNKGWYLYYPGQKYPTYNVNALTLYFLGFVKTLNFTISASLDSKIDKIVNLVVEEQEENGSWYYSRSPKGKWVDGFHSAFVVESIAFLYKSGFNGENIKNCLDKGINYYIDNMFTEDGFPKYFDYSGKYPVESQNVAQAIQTLSLLNVWIKKDNNELLKKNIQNAIKILYNGKGGFYQMKGKYWTYKQLYSRWSITPMILAFEYAKKSLNQDTI